MAADQSSSVIYDGRYQLSETLGSGSTGTVWQALDLERGETVALKIIDAAVLRSPSTLKRFTREVESTRRLRHPHCVEVRAYGRAPDGSGYLVMERLVGTTLAARLRSTSPLPQMRAVQIMAQVLDAVGAAHQLQIVHRDLKPSNVMLIERDGDPDFVKVCDFGLAKAIEPESDDPLHDGGVSLDLGSITTEQGAICGTPEYMAPEQARGEAIDARADLYAVAVMLYQAVTGQLPFSGRSPLAVVSQHLSSKPPRPSELRPDLELFPPLENLILRALAKDKAERPSSAHVFRADLLQIARDHARRTTRARGFAARSRTSDAATLPSGTRSTTRSRRLVVGSALCGALAASALIAALSSPGTSPKPLARSTLAAIRPPALVVQRTAPSATPIVEHAAPTAPAPRRTRPKPQPSPLERAGEHLARGELAEACALARREAARRPDVAETWKFLGRCEMRLGDRARAVTAYRRYLALAPSAPDAVFVTEIVNGAEP